MLLPPNTDPLRLAVAAYLARFNGQSRIHAESDLRAFVGSGDMSAMPAGSTRSWRAGCSALDREHQMRDTVALNEHRGVTEDDRVKHARERGYSWAFFASLVGTSDEAARQRSVISKTHRPNGSC